MVKEMKRVLKIVLSVLFVLVLIASIGFNILFFNSSYSALMFRRDENALNAMISQSYLIYDESLFLSQKNKSYIIDI